MIFGEKKIELYEGLILTTIELINLPDEKKYIHLEDGDKVTFRKDGENTPDKAAFLNNITEVTPGVFEAIFVSIKKAVEIAKGGPKTDSDRTKGPDGDRTALFCIHGLTVEPATKMKKVIEARAFFENRKTFYPIPVIWPSEGKVSAYTADRTIHTLKAGKILNALTKSIPNDAFSKKALMCHSLGNHLLLHSSDVGDTPDVKFDNIFMVAADVPADIFTDNPNESAFKNIGEKALNITNMLADNGKIYVLYNESDRALWFSSIVKDKNRFRKRLGSSGAYKLRDEFENKVKNVNTTKVDTGDFLMHGYHYRTTAVDFYDFVHSTEQDWSHDFIEEAPGSDDPNERGGLFSWFN